MLGCTVLVLLKWYLTASVLNRVLVLLFNTFGLLLCWSVFVILDKPQSTPFSSRDHLSSTYAKFSKGQTFLTPWYALGRVHIRGLEMLVYRKILRTCLMDGPLSWQLWIRDPLVLGRSSQPGVFLAKFILKICSKCTGDHPCRRVISMNLQSNFIEITLRHGCSPVNLLHIFRTLFTKSTSERKLLATIFFFFFWHFF